MNRAAYSAKFRNIRRVRAGSDFGTVGGLYSIAELIDLVAAKDVEVKTLGNDSANFLPQWQASDAATAGNWQADFTSLMGRYNAARADAEAAIAAAHSGLGNLVPDNLTTNPGDVQYQAILSALNANWRTNDASTPGSIEDLRARLSNAGASLSAYSVPQPRTGSDASINVLHAADSALNSVATLGGVLPATLFGMPTLAVLGVGAVGLAAVVVLKR